MLFSSVCPRVLENDEARAGGVQGDPHAVPSPLDHDLREGREMEPLGEIFPHPQVFVQLVCIVIAYGEPLGAPVTIDNESESDGVYFLSHD